ncbi:MAG TPA: helix-turn-helix domain-containing protein [Armatimonadota bacterium]
MTNRIRELRTEKGWSQADLAERLGVSRQTANALEAGRTDPSLSLAFRISWVLGRPLEEIFLCNLEEKMSALQANWQYQDRIATGFDEVGILGEMGREGWEMVGFGPFMLHFRRPEDADLREPWEYERLSGILGIQSRVDLETQGWSYCGSWMGLFHYFKRPDRKVN